MLKVLIVDDETVSRKYISSLIEWEKCGYELCTPACSAKDALNILAHTHIDIVLLDVFMPGENGVILSKKISRYYPSVAMIAISSYDDYDYVSEILKNGVHDYILKHRLNAEVLSAALKSMGDHLQHTEVRESSVVLRQDVENWICKNAACPFPVDGRWLTLTVATVDWSHDISNDVKIYITDGILRIFESSIDEGQVASAVCLPAGRFVICTLFSNAVSISKIKKDLYINNMKSRNSIELVYHLNLITQECPITTKREKLPLYEAEAAERLKYSLHNEKNKNDSGISLTLAQKKQILLVLEERNSESAEIFIRDIYNHFTESDIGSHLLVTKELLEILRAAMREYQADLEFLPKGESLFKWVQSKKSEELVSCIAGMYRQVIREASVTLCNYSENVSRANTYIDNHYPSNIGLKDVADDIGISSSYLSRIYSQETGMTLTDYLNRVRINAAKGYLKSGMSLKETAARCGFVNYNYFFKVFKDYEDITPRDFLNQKNENSKNSGANNQ